MDANNGKVLFSQNAAKKIYPASTVKIMTALVVLSECKTTQKIKVTSQMLKQVPSDASDIDLKAGSTYTVSTLLHMLLLPSAADAAMVLSIGTCGSEKKFVKKMNAMAKKLGLSKTNFDNTIGLDTGNGYYHTYTTARDFAKMTRYAMANEVIRKIVAKASYKVPKSKNKKAFRIYNTNPFYRLDDRKSLYTVIGTKTGTTRAAGSVLIATAKDQDGHEVICAFFGNYGSTQRTKDIKKLLNYTFKQYKKGKLKLIKGFYDTRFLSSNSVIRYYYNKGLISGENGCFYPKKEVKEKTFVNTINKITGSNLQAIEEDKNVTILSFAMMYENAYPKECSKEDIEQKISDLKGVDALSEEELNALTNLYTSNILPSDISKNINKTLTKENMVLIAKQLRKKLLYSFF